MRKTIALVTKSVKERLCIKARPATCLAVAGLALAACTEQPQSYSEMSEGMTLALREDGTATASGKTVSLASGYKTAVKAAVLANESYRVSQYLESGSRSAIKAAASARRAQVGFNARLGGAQGIGGTSTDLTTGGSGSLNISQLVYDGGATLAGVNQATARAIASRAERNALANGIALEAGTAWIDVWQHQARLGLLRSRTKDMDALVAQIDRMAANGIGDRSALESARRQLADIALEETRIESDLQDAKVRFQRYFGQVPGGVGRPADLVSLATIRSAMNVPESNPLVRQRMAEVLIARNELAAAEAGFRPQVSVQAQLTPSNLSDQDANASVGMVVNYVIADGGLRDARLEGATAGVAAAEAQLADEQRNLKADQDAALARLRSVDRSAPLVAEKIRLSEAETSTARSQITTGQSNLRQLVEAEIERYRSQDRQIALQAERKILVLGLAARTGALARVLGLALPDDQ